MVLLGPVATRGLFFGCVTAPGGFMSLQCWLAIVARPWV